MTAAFDPDATPNPFFEVHPTPESVTETLASVDDLGNQVLKQFHEGFDSFHYALEQINSAETQDLGAAPPIPYASLNVCGKWQLLKPSISRIITTIQTISVIVPSLYKVVLILNTLSGLLDTLCPVPPQKNPDGSPILDKPLTY